jgi:hypothetical protein
MRLSSIYPGCSRRGVTLKVLVVCQAPQLSSRAPSDPISRWWRLLRKCWLKTHQHAVRVFGCSYGIVRQNVFTESVMIVALRRPDDCRRKAWRLRIGMCADRNRRDARGTARSRRPSTPRQADHYSECSEARRRRSPVLLAPRGPPCRWRARPTFGHQPSSQRECPGQDPVQSVCSRLGPT